jgi:hypothetical protein
MEAWRIHFENLAIPNLDENKFDLERISLCTIQNDIIAEVTANKVKIPPATEAEVTQAIRKLNNGKAADENGIQAEHFKFANAELATEICNITNQILACFTSASVAGGIFTLLAVTSAMMSFCIVQRLFRSRSNLFSSRLGVVRFSKCILQASIILFWLY